MIARLDLGKGATDFVRERVLIAGEEGGVLAGLLAEREFVRPFAYLDASKHSRAALDLTGWQVGDAYAAERLESIVGRWLQAAPVQARRCLAFEEMLARRSDASVVLRTDAYFDDRVFSIAQSGGPEAEVNDAVAGFSGAPGIGVLAETTREFSRDLSAEDLGALARGAVAVLVPAWDDEAFIVAPTSDDFADALRAIDRTSG